MKIIKEIEMQELKEMREVNAEPEPPRKVYVQFCKTQQTSSFVTCLLTNFQLKFPIIE